MDANANAEGSTIALRERYSGELKTNYLSNSNSHVSITEMLSSSFVFYLCKVIKAWETVEKSVA